MARRPKEDYTGKRFGSITLWREIELARVEHAGVTYHQISRAYYEPTGEAICADAVVAAGNWVRLTLLEWEPDQEKYRQAALSWGDNVPDGLYIDWAHPTRALFTDRWLNLHTFERAVCADPAGPGAGESAPPAANVPGDPAAGEREG